MMRSRLSLALTLLFLACACGQQPSGTTPSGCVDAVDTDLAAIIAGLRAVDNHTHVASTMPNDLDTDALPLDGLAPFDLPASVRPEHPKWIPAFAALFGYPHADVTEQHLADLRAARARIVKEQGDKFPEFVLDKIGTEVMLANRIALGPGLAPPRFRWVPFADALMLPLSTAGEAAGNPD